MTHRLRATVGALAVLAALNTACVPGPPEDIAGATEGDDPVTIARESVLRIRAIVTGSSPSVAPAMSSGGPGTQAVVSAARTASAPTVARSRWVTSRRPRPAPG